MAINQFERAFKAWNVLTERAASRKTITYGELGAKIGVHHRAIRYILHFIQNYCLEEKLPPLTILIINQGGLPGSGFIAYDVDHFEEGKELVFSFNWSSIVNPYSFASDGSSIEEIVDRLTKEPEFAEEAMQKVKARGIAQLIFRKALLMAYDGKCCFTGISTVCALDAAHIIPWSKCNQNEKLDIRNGILLNAFHHRLFDGGLINIDCDYRITFSISKIVDDASLQIQKSLFSDLNGNKIRLPSSSFLSPKYEYLYRRLEMHKSV